MTLAAPAVAARETDAAPLITAIDAQGRLYPIEKMAAHQAGTLHLAVSVFVFCGDALLLQRRAPGKYHCGGLWANTCCSHPAWGEAVADSAQRRLREELGINVALRACDVIDYEADVTNGLREHERVHVFRGDVTTQALSFRPDPDEVSELRWTPVREVRQVAAASPEAFAPWFRIYLSRWAELGL